MVKKKEIMGNFFYLPPNAKIVKWTKNSNAKSKNLTLESTKSQWQTPPWLVEWLGSPPWLSSLSKCRNKSKKTPCGSLKPTNFSAGNFFSSTHDFFPKNRSIFPAILKK